MFLFFVFALDEFVTNWYFWEHKSLVPILSTIVNGYEIRISYGEFEESNPCQDSLIPMIF